MSYQSLPTPPRIRIFGLSGSGKTTLAKTISNQLSTAFLEEDSIHFENHFKLVEKSVVIKKTEEFIKHNDHIGWVSDGFRKLCHEKLMPSCNVIIFLDYPIYLILYRLFKRTFKRCWYGESLWGLSDCKESFNISFSLTNDSVIYYMLKSYWNGSTQNDLDIVNDWLNGKGSSECGDKRFFVFKSPEETNAFLYSLHKKQ